MLTSIHVDKVPHASLKGAHRSSNKGLLLLELRWCLKEPQGLVPKLFRNQECLKIPPFLISQQICESNTRSSFSFSSLILESSAIGGLRWTNGLQEPKTDAGLSVEAAMFASTR